MTRVSRLAMSLMATGLVAVLGIGRPAPASVASASLNRTMPPLKFDSVSLGDCLDFLRDVTGANINANWKALGEANITRDMPITLRLSGVPLRKALSVVLNEVAGGDALTFYSEDNVIEITTKADADKQTFVRVFPIDDLIVDVPDFTDAPKFGLSDSGNGGGNSGAGGGNNRMLIPNGGGSQSQEKIKTKEERAQDLVALITATIQPDAWRDSGGNATIRYFNGNLIVSGPRSLLEAIGGPME